MTRMESFPASAYGYSDLQYPRGHLHHGSGSFSQPQLTSLADRATDFFQYDTPFPSTEPPETFRSAADLGGNGRGRMTRDEIAHLEQELVSNAKPKTSHKSELAQKIRQIMKPNVSLCRSLSMMLS